MLFKFNSYFPSYIISLVNDKWMLHMASCRVVLICRGQHIFHIHLYFSIFSFHPSILLKKLCFHRHYVYAIKDTLGIHLSVRQTSERPWAWLGGFHNLPSLFVHLFMPSSHYLHLKKALRTPPIAIQFLL